MSGVEVLSLRGGREPDEPKGVVTFRFQPELIAYVERVAKEPNRNKTEVVASAIELDRDLDEKLSPDRARLLAFAESQGLSMAEDLAEVLARAVRLGLDALAKPKR